MNPLYDWARLAATGYDWWKRRLGRALELYDVVRIDHFRGFAAYWEVPAEAADARFEKNQGRVAHRAELESLLEETIGALDREPLLKRLEEADVPATPVNTVDQVMSDPQTAERGIVQRVTHPRLGEIPVVGTPLHFSGMSPGVRHAAPLRGEHTDAVLGELGYTPEQIHGLRAKKVAL